MAPSHPATTPKIREATTDAEIGQCWTVMHALRPQLAEADFLPRVRAMMTDGYRLVASIENGSVRAVAGFRLGDKLAWGRHVYVDDLVSAPDQRGRGHGTALLQWLLALAQAAGCASFHLDSGVQRFGAHRFYLRHGLDITSHHFACQLPR